jgi:hypothetical protein
MEPFKFTLRNTARLAFAVAVMSGLAMGLFVMVIGIGSTVVEFVQEGQYLIATEVLIWLSLSCAAYHWLANWTLAQFVKYKF